MEDVLRWSLLIVGGCVILGILVHGIWVSRKNRDNVSGKRTDYPAEQDLESGGWRSDGSTLDDQYPNEDQLTDTYVSDKTDDLDASLSIDFNLDMDESSSEFDDLGLGAVRVVPNSAKEQQASESVESNNAEQTEDVVNDDVSSEPSTGKVYASVVTQPKPEFADKYQSQSLAAETRAISQQEKASAPVGKDASTDDMDNAEVSEQPEEAALKASAASKNFASDDNYDAPEPPPFLLKKEAEGEELKSKPSVLEKSEPAHTETPKKDNPAEKVSLAEQARNLVKRKKTDSNRKRREPKIAEDQMRIDFDEAEPATEEATKPSSEKEDVSQNIQQEVLVLNVKAAEGEAIPGAALLPMLLTLGFKFGDQDIFHRHVNSSGKGPVLFSLANMFKPGDFDIDNLENFTTQGVSLFMILPIEGDPHQVFNMMHNAARKIADEFSASVYDGRRALLTKQSLQQYVEKIREFERQRMLKR